MLHNKTKVAGPGRRRFAPVATLASVALVGGTIAWGGTVAWGVTGNGDSSRASTTVSTTSTSTTSTSSTSTTASNAAGTGVSTQMALPVYFVGATFSTKDLGFGLYREFVRTAVPAGATPAQKARAAVEVAMKSHEFTNVESYLQPWSGTSVRDLTVTPRLITITLSGPGAKGFTDDQTRLAIQGLVWTAQAAVGQGPIPVRFALADGSASLFGAYATSETFNRPARELQYQDLAPIWITSPVLHQVFPAGTPVVAKGESDTFEANTNWQLNKGGVTVRSGFATASSTMAASRGVWQVRLGVLAAGEYTFRMFEPQGPNEGTEIGADTSKTFTVK